MEEKENQELSENKKDLMSADELNKLIRGELIDNPKYEKYYSTNPFGQQITIDGNLFDEEVILLDNPQTNVSVRFYNCEFKKEILFAKVKFTFLILSNCKLESVVIQNESHIHSFRSITSIIENCEVIGKSEIGNLDLENSTVNSINLNNATVTKVSSKKSTVNAIYLSNAIGQLLTINESNVSEIHISNCNQFYNISFNNSLIDLVRVEFVENLNRIQIFNSTKINIISISESASIDAITIQKEVLLGELSITTSSLNTLSVQESQLESIYIDTLSKVSNIISIRESVIEKIALLQSVINSINIWGDSKIRELKIHKENSNISTLNIKESFIQKLILETINTKSINLNNTSIVSFLIRDSIFNKDSNIYISNLDVSNLKIDDTLFNGTSIFNGINALSSFEGFKEYKSLSFGERAITDENDKYVFETFSTSTTIVSVVNSDLGKTQLVNFNINAFKTFEYKNSKMLEVFVAETEFPERNNISHPNKSATNAEKLEQQRLALSQFKKIYENRGDNVRATQALAEEMEVYRLQLQKIPFHLPKWYKPLTWHHAYTKNKEWWKYLITVECWKSVFTKQWWNNRSERVNLWLNKFSNFYGNNWLRGVITTVSINSLLFWAYSYSLNFKLGPDWEMFRYLVAYSFEFLNPLRKADFLTDKFKDYGIILKASPATIAIDYLSRIIIAYFVYQTIAAFRKFGKKSG